MKLVIITKYVANAIILVSVVIIPHNLDAKSVQRLVIGNLLQIIQITIIVYVKLDFLIKMVLQFVNNVIIPVKYNFFVTKY